MTTPNADDQPTMAEQAQSRRARVASAFGADRGDPPAVTDDSAVQVESELQDLRILMQDYAGLVPAVVRHLHHEGEHADDPAAILAATHTLITAFRHVAADTMPGFRGRRSVDSQAGPPAPHCAQCARDR